MKKKSNVIFSALLIALVVLTSAFIYKGGHDPAKRAKKQTEWMKKELSLSDEQTGKVEDINLKYAQKKHEIMEQMHKQMKALEQDKNKDLQGVLSKEQLSQYQSKKEEMRKKRKEEFRKHHKDGKPNEGKKE